MLCWNDIVPRLTVGLYGRIKAPPYSCSPPLSCGSNLTLLPSIQICLARLGVDVGKSVKNVGRNLAVSKVATVTTIAASINGDDFVPFNDAIFVKQAGLGGSVSWHQDGVTHWDSPNWDPGIHGFNFQVQLYASTPANCLWVMPGTHKLGRIDIREQVRQNESERLPGAVPLTCKSGDVTIVNRQMLHCSFALSLIHI
mgnify:CR=1 FL=1